MNRIRVFTKNETFIYDTDQTTEFRGDFLVIKNCKVIELHTTTNENGADLEFESIKGSRISVYHKIELVLYYSKEQR